MNTGISIAAELNRIVQAKNSLRIAIIDKGVQLAESALLDEFAAAVSMIRGDSLDLSTVTVSADKLLSGVIAVNSTGELITGTIETVTPSIADGVLTVPAGYHAESNTYELGGAGTDSESKVYACASVDASNSKWSGYEVTITDTVMSAAATLKTLSYSGTAPTVGKSYTADGRFLAKPSGYAIDGTPLIVSATATANLPIGVSVYGVSGYDSNNEVTYTLEEAPEWITQSGEYVTGTAPAAGTYTAKVKVSSDNCVSTLSTVIFDVREGDGTEPWLYLPLESAQEYAATGQRLILGSTDRAAGLSNATYCGNDPDYTTYEGYKCAWFGSEYDNDIEDTQHGYIRTVEVIPALRSKDRTFSMLAYPTWDRYYGESIGGIGGVSVGTASNGRAFALGADYYLGWDSDTGEDVEYWRTMLDCWNRNWHSGEGLRNTGNGWYHCVGALKDGRMYMWIRKVEAGSTEYSYGGEYASNGGYAPGTFNTATGELYVGSYSASPNSYPFNGYLAQIKVWTRAITKEEREAEFMRLLEMKQ